MPSDQSNQSVYESAALASKYALDSTLQPPEHTILRIVAERLRPSRILDIGVGGGRTTAAFSGIAAEYVGIDYSETMISAVRSRFLEIPGKLSFLVADVRSMEMFPDASFDFVLFSYNGIDYVSHVSRMQALREIRRVARRSGLFAFSSHNLNSLEKRQQLFTAGSIKATISNWLWLLRFWRHNGLHRLADKAYFEGKDGALDFQLRTHYQRPEMQIDELKSAGFSDIRVFGLADGLEISEAARLEQNVEDWLYYLCA